MKDDLISRNTLYREICGLPSNIGLYDADEVERLVKAAPAVDAVEVVRCRDCKHGKPNGNGTYYCYQDKFTIRLDLKPDHYCAYGERRADDENMD